MHDSLELWTRLPLLHNRSVYLWQLFLHRLGTKTTSSSLSWQDLLLIFLKLKRSWDHAWLLLWTRIPSLRYRPYQERPKHRQWFSKVTRSCNLIAPIYKQSRHRYQYQLLYYVCLIKHCSQQTKHQLCNEPQGLDQGHYTAAEAQTNTLLIQRISHQSTIVMHYF